MSIKFEELFISVLNMFSLDLKTATDLKSTDIQALFKKNT